MTTQAQQNPHRAKLPTCPQCRLLKAEIVELRTDLVAAHLEIVSLRSQMSQATHLLPLAIRSLQYVDASLVALPLLTRREHQVLLLYLEIPNDKQVARRLGTKRDTVKNQLRSIGLKLGVSSRAALLALLTHWPAANKP